MSYLAYFKLETKRNFKLVWVPDWYSARQDFEGQWVLDTIV